MMKLEHQLRMGSSLTEFELGWLVGILEGEGYFGYGSRTRVVEVTMTDEDTMNQLASVLKKVLGKECEAKARSEHRSNRKIPYRLLISGDDAIKIMRLVVSYMSVRRRKRIWQAINGYTQPKTKIDMKALVSSIVEQRRANG